MKPKRSRGVDGEEKEKPIQRLMTMTKLAISSCSGKITAPIASNLERSVCYLALLEEATSPQDRAAAATVKEEPPTETTVGGGDAAVVEEPPTAGGGDAAVMEEPPMETTVGGGDKAIMEEPPKETTVVGGDAAVMEEPPKETTVGGGGGDTAIMEEPPTETTVGAGGGDMVMMEEPPMETIVGGGGAAAAVGAVASVQTLPAQAQTPLSREAWAADVQASMRMPKSLLPGGTPSREDEASIALSELRERLVAAKVQGFKISEPPMDAEMSAEEVNEAINKAQLALLPKKPTKDEAGRGRCIMSCPFP